MLKNAFWLVKDVHVTWNIQSECFISAMLNFVYDMGSISQSCEKKFWLNFYLAPKVKRSDWLFKITLHYLTS